MAQSFYGTEFLSASATLHLQRNPEKHRGLVDSNLHTFLHTPNGQYTVGNNLFFSHKHRCLLQLQTA